MVTEENKRCVFETLDAIRESGEMNVFGTARWLVKNGFVENKIDARLLVMEWMKSESSVFMGLTNDECDLMNEGELL